MKRPAAKAEEPAKDTEEEPESNESEEDSEEEASIESSEDEAKALELPTKEESELTLHKPRITNAKTRKASYITAEFHDGKSWGRHLVVEVSSKMCDNYEQVIKKIQWLIIQRNMNKDDALELREKLVLGPDSLSALEG